MLYPERVCEISLVRVFECRTLGLVHHPDSQSVCLLGIENRQVAEDYEPAVEPDRR